MQNLHKKRYTLPDLKLLSSSFSKQPKLVIAIYITRKNQKVKNKIDRSKFIRVGKKKFLVFFFMFLIWHLFLHLSVSWNNFFSLFFSLQYFSNYFFLSIYITICGCSKWVVGGKEITVILFSSLICIKYNMIWRWFITNKPSMKPRKFWIEQQIKSILNHDDQSRTEKMNESKNNHWRILSIKQINW